MTPDDAYAVAAVIGAGLSVSLGSGCVEVRVPNYKIRYPAETILEAQERLRAAGWTCRRYNQGYATMLRVTGRPPLSEGLAAVREGRADAG